jgi:hypothetical protein
MEKLNKQEIINWGQSIEESELPTSQFLEKYDVPFNERQYYRYKAKMTQDGISKFDSDYNPRNRKLFQREEDFLKGVIAENPQVSLNKLQ